MKLLTLQNANNVNVHGSNECVESTVITFSRKGGVGEPTSEVKAIPTC